MPSSGFIFGKNFNIEIDGVDLAHAISNGQDVNTDMDEVTNKDSSTYKEFLPTWNDLTIDFEAKLRIDIAGGTAGYVILQTAHHTQAQVAYIQGTATSGDHEFAGNAYISNIALTADNTSYVNFTGSLQNTGDPTFSAKSL